jgi:hypothetical protein
LKNTYEVRGETVAINLAGGLECLIDEKALPRVSRAAGTHSWFAKLDTRDGIYRVVAKLTDGEIFVRRVVAEASAEMVVSMKNRDGLDCRAANLKISFIPPRIQAPLIVPPQVPEGAQLVPLNRSFAIVDSADAEMVRKYRWKENQGYAVRSNGRAATLSMHRLIIGAVDGQYVDHINGNPLDNRRSNLRACTNAENSWNAKKQKRSKSPLKGITLNKSTGKFRAQIMINYKKINLGDYPTPEEAARVYDVAARQHFGAFARPNFPAPEPAA